jgi:alpha-1,3-glucosyltransferase
MVELEKSRGYETYSSKIFMRLTVLISDIAIFLPALFYFVIFGYCKKYENSKKVWS